MSRKGSDKVRATGGLVRSCEAAKILGVSREYVRQLVINNILPPKYLFNANSWRKIYIFDRKLVERFSDPKERKKVKWKEPETCTWMTAVELSKVLKCTPDWIYSATQKGFLEPEIVIASSRQKLRLYDKDRVEEAMKMNMDRRSSRRGHSQKTLNLMDRIRKLHTKGMNDSHIAIKTRSTQPFISKLRKEMGLISNARIASTQRKAAMEEMKRLKSGGKAGRSFD